MAPEKADVAGRPKSSVFSIECVPSLPHPLLPLVFHFYRGPFTLFEGVASLKTPLTPVATVFFGLRTFLTKSLFSDPCFSMERPNCDEIAAKMREVQDDICKFIVDNNGGVIFHEDNWQHTKGAGGGRSRLWEGGVNELLEKAGVNFSDVGGSDLPKYDG